jgi:hypothetical protein
VFIDFGSFSLVWLSLGFPLESLSAGGRICASIFPSFSLHTSNAVLVAFVTMIISCDAGQINDFILAALIHR